MQPILLYTLVLKHDFLSLWDVKSMRTSYSGEFRLRFLVLFSRWPHSVLIYSQQAPSLELSENNILKNLSNVRDAPGYFYVFFFQTTMLFSLNVYFFNFPGATISTSIAVEKCTRSPHGTGWEPLPNHILQCISQQILHFISYLSVYIYSQQAPSLELS